MSHLADLDQRPHYHATIKKTKRLTPAEADEIREITLEVQEPNFDCAVDQSFGVLVPHESEFGTSSTSRVGTTTSIVPVTTGSTYQQHIIHRGSHMCNRGMFPSSTVPCRM